MYDIVFVDVPYINYETDEELRCQINNYRKDCEFIIKEQTGIDAAEKPYFYSMGILCLSSYLKKNIKDIKIGYIHYHINMDEYQAYIENAKVVAFSTMTVTMNTIMELSKRAHEINPDIKIILGGYHASYLANELLKDYSFIDCIFLNEGEQALLDYMSGKEKQDIIGIVFRNNKGKIISNPFENYLDSNDIPMPDYTLIENNLYNFNIHLSTMRGCVGKCNFCVNNSYWKCPRLISVTNIIEELLFLKARLPKGTIIHIIDNIFTMSKDRLMSLYNCMEEYGLLGYFKFECDTLCTFIDKEKVNLLEDIGVFKVCLGIEDCNDEILKFSNKNTTFARNVEAAKIIKENSKNICVYAYWLIGLPGSTLETLAENLVQMKRLIVEDLVDIISPKIFIPYPGTQFFENPKLYGINIESYDWDLYERRNPPFPYYYDKISNHDLYIYLLESLNICHEAYVNKYGEK